MFDKAAFLSVWTRPSRGFGDTRIARSGSKQLTVEPTWCRFSLPDLAEPFWLPKSHLVFAGESLLRALVERELNG